MTIKQKQWQLYYLGYYGGEINGIWGARSKAATLGFQKDNGLDVDGIFVRYNDSPILHRFLWKLEWTYFPKHSGAVDCE